MEEEAHRSHLAVLDEAEQGRDCAGRQAVDAVQDREPPRPHGDGERRRLPQRLLLAAGRAALQQVAGGHVLVDEERLDRSVAQRGGELLADEGLAGAALADDQHVIPCPSQFKSPMNQLN